MRFILRSRVPGPQTDGVQDSHRPLFRECRWRQGLAGCERRQLSRSGKAVRHDRGGSDQAALALQRRRATLKTRSYHINTS